MLKSVAFSKFLCYARIGNFRGKDINSFKRYVANFIWQKKMEIIKRGQIFQPIENGGLNLPEPKNFEIVCKCQRMLKSLKNNNICFGFCKYFLGHFARMAQKFLGHFAWICKALN